MFCCIRLFIQYLNINLTALILIMVFFSGVFVVKYFAQPKKKKHLHVVDAEELEPASLQNTKVLTLFIIKTKLH